MAHDQNPPEWAGEQTGFGLNAVVHSFGVVRDCKLGGVSESSEMSEQARVVWKKTKKETCGVTGANSSKRVGFQIVPGLKYCILGYNLIPSDRFHILETSRAFDPQSSSKLCQKRDMKTPRVTTARGV
jgi:hypothetical protein